MSSADTPINPLASPGGFSPDERTRYARHIMLHEVGGRGQQRLKAAKVALVGAGGLGAPVGLYLAAAGVGRLRLIDADTVSLSNLQRQVLYQTADIGEPKVARAASALGALNPHCTVDAVAEQLTTDNAADLLSGFDVVVDGTDDFATRFAVNDACLALALPLVSGALARWQGQVGVFGCHMVGGAQAGPCYRCFVPEVPEQIETCEAVGVIGALAGVIGTVMALEVVKLLTGAGEPLLGRLWLYDGLQAESRTIGLHRDPECPACGQAHA
jgi:molybdopterin/thiamine biosynthesis adenylyltransferase